MTVNDVIGSELDDAIIAASRELIAARETRRTDPQRFIDAQAHYLALLTLRASA